MTALTPTQLGALRAQLRPFEKGTPPSPELLAYQRFYGLDFAAGRKQQAHRIGLVSSGDYKLAVQLWLQQGATSNLLLVHGYTDHTGVFDKLVEWGLDLNCNVLIFDLPGHGLSSGEPAVIDNFSDYSRAIDDVLGAASLPDLPLWAVGQSTGCAALMDFARHYDWPFVATVFLAPLVRPTRWRLVKLAANTLRPFTAHVDRKFTRNTSDGAFLETLKRDPLQPGQMSLRWIKALARWLNQLTQTDLGVGDILVVQGDADETVDWQYNVPVVQELFPGSTVEYLSGAGHQLANEAAPMRSDYLARMKSWLQQRGLPV